MLTIGLCILHCLGLLYSHARIDEKYKSIYCPLNLSGIAVEGYGLIYLTHQLRTACFSSLSISCLVMDLVVLSDGTERHSWPPTTCSLLNRLVNLTSKPIDQPF